MFRIHLQTKVLQNNDKTKIAVFKNTTEIGANSQKKQYFLCFSFFFIINFISLLWQTLQNIT